MALQLETVPRSRNEQAQRMQSKASQVASLPVAEWVAEALKKHVRTVGGGVLTKSAANEIIKQYFAAQSEAECSGQDDFAALKNGGIVVPQLTSRSGTGGSSWLGSQKPSAREAIGRGNEPGQCWPFRGPRGFLTVKLANNIRVRSVTIMHLHPRIAKDGDVRDAPKDFEVYAYEPRAPGSTERGLGRRFPVGGGTFTAESGCWTFPMMHHTDRIFRYVTLNITSNHGGMDTCLYRFMVHGDPATAVQA